MVFGKEETVSSTKKKSSFPLFFDGLPLPNKVKSARTLDDLLASVLDITLSCYTSEVPHDRNKVYELFNRGF